MKLIIDIPEEEYELVRHENKSFRTELELMNAVANGTPLPKDATNGDVIEAMFPDTEEIEDRLNEIVVKVLGSYRSINRSWWNAPYNGGGTE